MKKISLIILISMFFKLSAGNLNAYLYLAQFKSPEQGPYIECYLNIIGNSVVYAQKPNGSFEANLEVLYLFKQADEIKAFEKYQLNSPILKDSTSTIRNFTDVQRILLPEGIYNFEVHIKDKNDSTSHFNYQSIIAINFSKEHQFSDIEMVESYQESTTPSNLTKGNIDIIPYVSSFYPTYLEKFTFYTELYNENKGEDLLLHYYIQDLKTDKIINQFSSYQKIKSEHINPFLGGFNIKNLPTGNYNLVLNLKNRENKLLSEKQFFFQRYNSNYKQVPDTLKLNSYVLPELSYIESIDKMREYIKCVFPIYNQREIYKAQNALTSNDINIMKSFFNQFWHSYSSNPQKDWAIYRNNVELINRSYTSQIKKGYETDRGRVYLKYGTPSEINRSSHEPSSYPYEIWHYFELNGETDVRFVFYNPDISGDDYRLLHSTLTTEINNPYWQRDLTRRNSSKPLDFDDTKGESQYGNRAKDVYRR